MVAEELQQWLLKTLIETTRRRELMEKGRCLFPIVAGRREPAEKAEMITQLIYGESYEIIDSNEEWIKIRILRDSYECWIDKKLHSTYTEYNSNQVLTDPFNTYKDLSMLLPASAMVDGNASDGVSSIIESAKKFLGAPYLWGGKTIWGCDCSGFVQVVFQIHGMDISRDAYQQAELGENVEFNAMIEPGDLAFFSKENERISHVGICMSNEKIIHASGMVRIDKFDHHGIFNEDLNKYTHELRVIKRIKKAAI